MTTNIDYSYGVPVDIILTPPPASDPAAPPFREHLQSRRDGAQPSSQPPQDEHRGQGPSLYTLSDDEATTRPDASERGKSPDEVPASAGERQSATKQPSGADVDAATAGDEEILIDHGGIPSIDEESPIADEAYLEDPHEALPTISSGNPQASDDEGGNPKNTNNSSGNTDSEIAARLSPRPTRDPGDPKPTPLPQPVPPEPEPEEKGGKKGKPGGKHKGDVDAVIGRPAKEPRSVKDKGEGESHKAKSAKRATANDGLDTATRHGKASGAPETRGSKAAAAGSEQASASKARRHSKGSKFDKIDPHEPVADGAKGGLRVSKFPILISREISETTAAVADQNTRNQTTDGPKDGKSAAVNSVPVDGDAAPTTASKGDGPGNRLSTLLGHKGVGEAREQPPLNDAQQARLVQRVTKAFDVARARGEAAVRLRLAPPELGSLRLEVQVESGSLIARLEVETPAAREVLLDNLNTLRQRLAEQGIRVDQFDVDLLDRQNDDRWQSGEQGQHNQDAPSDDRRPAGADEREQVSPTLQTPTIERLLDEGVIDVII